MCEPTKLLRNKIWAILSVGCSILIVSILAIIYILMSNNTQRVIYQALNMRVTSEEKSFEDVFFTAFINNGEVGDIYAGSLLSTSFLDSLVADALPFIDKHYYKIISEEEQTWAYILCDDGIYYNGLGYEQKRLLFINVTDLMSKVEHLLYLLIALGGEGIILAFIGSFFMATQLVKPTLIAFAKEREVNAMQKRFIANASHELRTPLTLIKGGYEEVLDYPEETIANLSKWFNIIGFGISRMESLTTELMTLSKVENNKIEMEDVVDLADLVRTIVEMLELRIKQKEIAVTINKQTPVIVKQNMEKLEQVILILLENAVKHVNNQGWIQIDIEQLPAKVKIVVANSGKVISSEELPHIFERFYRGKDLVEKSEGHGLGLSIAKETVELLGGEIFVECVEKEVTIFSFVLPTNK